MNIIRDHNSTLGCRMSSAMMIWKTSLALRLPMRHHSHHVVNQSPMRLAYRKALCGHTWTSDECAALTIQAWHRQSNYYFSEQAIVTQLFWDIYSDWQWTSNDQISDTLQFRFRLRSDLWSYTCKRLRKSWSWNFSTALMKTCSKDPTFPLAGTVCQVKTYPRHELPIANR